MSSKPPSQSGVFGKQNLQKTNNNIIQQFIDEYVLDKEGATREGMKTKKYGDGSEYRGQTIKGVRIGVGMYKYYSGDVYLGDWKDDQMHGKGVIIYADAERYEGTFFKGLKHGMGNFYSLDGSVFKGEYSNGKREGSGSIKFGNGGRKV